MSGRAKSNKNTKAMTVRIICLALAALMVFSVIVSAIWY